jgi:hypothetical protein
LETGPAARHPLDPGPQAPPQLWIDGRVRDRGLQPHLCRRHGELKRPPIELIAQDLGTTPDAFREAAHRFLPRPPTGPPTEAQKRQVAAVLDISVEQLDSVMEKYRPDRLKQR